MARFLALSRWVLIGLILGTMLAPAAYSLTTGQHFVTVDGRSMTPTYQLGDLILVGSPSRADFAPGHVITVRATDGTLYTHRVIAIDHGEAQLKGDGNAVADPRLVPYNHVVGAVRGHIAQPAATVLGAVLEWPTRIFLAVIIIALLFLPTGTSSSAAAGREKRTNGARHRHRATDTAQRGDDDARPILLEHLFASAATSAHQEAAGERQHRQDNA